MDIIEHGFNRIGGFYVINHSRQVAQYAYPTSPLAVQAKRNPKAVLAKMLKGIESDLRCCPSHIIGQHYRAICESRKA